MTYVYETIPTRPDEDVRRFEVRQSIHDAPLTHDPETGEAVRRVISGGLGLMGVKSRAGGPTGHHHAGSGCGCGRGGCC